MSEQQPQSFEDFDPREFINILVMMDLQLVKKEQELQKVMRREEVDNALELMDAKRDIIKNILEYLADAYIKSNGEIADLSEFEVQSDRYLNLSLPFKGIALWIEVGKIIVKKEQAEKELEESRGEFGERAKAVT